jgi:hypothetical protein
VLGPAAKPFHVSLGFGAKGGLAAWIDDAGLLRVRPIDASGAPAGEASTTSIDKEGRTYGVSPLGADFVVTVIGPDRRRRAILVRPDGRMAGPLSPVGTPDFESIWPRAESRTGRYARIGYVKASPGGPGVWMETHANADGTVVEETRPLEPATKVGSEAGARVRGEGPMTILLPRSKTAVIQGHALPLVNASLARIDATRTLGGQWLPGSKPGLLGAPDRRLRIVWFEGDKLHVADVRADGTTSDEKTQPPLAPVVGVPDEIEVWGGGMMNDKGYAPSFSRRRVFLPQFKTVNGITSSDDRFRIPELDLDGGRILPIEDGDVEWSGTRIVYAYRENGELRVRAGKCASR